MYHIIADITDSNVEISDIVSLEVNPLYVDKEIRREYK